MSRMNSGSQGRFMIMVAAMALVDARAVVAASFHVNDKADAVDVAPGDANCKSASGGCTLRAAVQEANALGGADIIEIPAGVYALGIAGEFEDSGLTGDLDITDDLTLLGAGREETLLDGAGLDRVLDVPRTKGDARLSVESLTLRGGSHGGLRSLSSGSLTLRDCTVTRNEAPVAGGGIYKARGELLLVRTLVSDNHAVMQAGGIRMHGGVLELIDSEVSGNLLDGPSGAGIHATQSSVRIVGGSVIANGVRYGSGLRSRDTDVLVAGGTLTRVECIITDEPSAPACVVASVSGLR